MPKSVVCGLHRSGTTFVGEILRQAGANIIHEPLNKEFGMINVPTAYLYAEKPDEDYTGLIDDAFNFARRWTRDSTNSVAVWQARGDRLIWLRRLVYSITGGKNGLRWGGMRLRRRLKMLPENIIFKDPYLSLATPYIARKFDAKIVCMVRHPAAIFYSCENKNWQFDIENLLCQPDLVANYGAGISDDHWDLARTSNAASIAILWKIMVGINLSVAKNDARILAITHEFLCEQPVAFAKEICQHFDLPFTPQLDQYILVHTAGQRVEAKDGKLHDFTRNSNALANLWTQKVSPENQKIIDEIAGAEIAQIYGETANG